MAKKITQFVLIDLLVLILIMSQMHIIMGVKNDRVFTVDKNWIHRYPTANSYPIADLSMRDRSLVLQSLAKITKQIIKYEFSSSIELRKQYRKRLEPFIAAYNQGVR